MNPYYSQYLADIAQRNHDTFIMLLVCLGAAVAFVASGYMGKPIKYIVTGILSAAYFSLFLQGVMEVLK
jgi:lipopolysaccharide export LptBFGC system permease protein LptF